MKKIKNVSVNLNIPSFYAEDSIQIKSFRRRMTHRHYIKYISKQIKKINKPKILDIGCGTGSFLYCCEKSLKKSILDGVEYDQRLIEQARLNLRNAKISQGTAEKLPYDDSVFDVVTSFQVIEHVVNPDNMILEIRRVLKPNGIMVITTPNLNGLGRRVHGSTWTGYRDDHISLKASSDWSKHITEHNFRPLSVGTTFFTGINAFRSMPLSIINNTFLVIFGWLPWKLGESFVGIYQSPNDNISK